jgi:enamine deaminase RidA (YjgF/YER057c/UK114 family)
MSTRDVIIPSHPHFTAADGSSIFTRFQYSAAVKAGGLIFVAGQVGLEPDGSVPADPERQHVNVFERLKIVLEAAGSSLDDLVEIVSYHVDLPNHLAGFIKVKERYLKAPYPTWTILGVAALARPELKIEVRAVAVARDGH